MTVSVLRTDDADVRPDFRWRRLRRSGILAELGQAVVPGRAAVLGRAAVIVGAALLVAVGAPSPAFAQDNAARAAALSREAETLLAGGNTAAACAKLQESQTLDPRGSTALDLAVCREKEGRIASAYRAYGVAAELGKSEQRQDRVRTAQTARNKLFMRLPRITVKVGKDKESEGLTITANGEPVPSGEWNKPYPVDPGTVKVVASAPGKKSWETSIEIAVSRRQTVTVPALEAGADPLPAPVPGPVSQPDPLPGGGSGDPLNVPTPTPAPAPEPGGAGADHATLRPVVEIAFLGGLGISAINRAGLAELGGTSYQFDSGAGGEFIATCGDTVSFPGTGECDAGLATAFGGLVGGSAFVGVSLDPQVHVGARFMGAKRYPNGFWLGGGPSGSFRVAGPLWLGATVMLGTEEHVADVKSARGKVASAQQGVNGGEYVDIPLADLSFTTGEVSSGFLIGGALEVSLAILGPSPHAFVPTGRTEYLDGSLLVSLQPSMMVGSNGVIVAIPATVGYRFH